MHMKCVINYKIVQITQVTRLIKKTGDFPRICIPLVGEYVFTCSRRNKSLSIYTIHKPALEEI